VDLGIAINAAFAARTFEEIAPEQVSSAVAEDVRPEMGSAALVSLKPKSWR
jgi:hypothetical protein